jgi:uncharacterized protein YndB with AHSA1/START domain
MIKWLVRIGCAVGVLVIAVAGCLVLLGGGRRIAHTQTSVTFNHPAAQIWPWLVEPAHLKQWLGGFVDSIPENGGGLRVGARSKEIVELDGRRWEIGSQITALEPPRRIVLHMTTAEFEDDTEYLLTEHDGVTEVTYKNDAHYTTLIARLMSPIICHDVERKVQTDLAKLKGLLVREPPQTLIAPPKPGSQPAFAGCCAPEPSK